MEETEPDDRRSRKISPLTLTVQQPNPKPLKDQQKRQGVNALKPLAAISGVVLIRECMHMYDITFDFVTYTMAKNYTLSLPEHIINNLHPLYYFQ
jgi:hypothetical protein